MNIDISPELEKDFKKFVLEKHGKLRGKLGEEMENAIILYLARQKMPDTPDLSFLKKGLSTLHVSGTNQSEPEAKA